MLKRIRKSARNFAIKLLFIVLAIIFAFSVGDFSRGRSEVVAKIGGNKIYVEDFLQARQETFGQFDQAMPLEQKNMINYNVLMKLITQNIVKLEADNLGIKIAPEVIVDFIKKDKNFSKDGEFDIENYKRTLEYNNLSESRLLEVVSNQLASRFLLDSLVSNLPLKSTLSTYLYDFLSEKRLVTLTKIDLSEKEFSNIPEKDLEEFYQKTAEAYKSSEFRSFNYLFIDPKEIKKVVKINDEDLLQEFEENKEEYGLPETRDFYHFLAPNEAIAKQISESLKAGQDPAKLAKQLVSKRVISEVFNNQPAQSFLSSLNLSLFSLPENEVPNPVKSELGWHVFKILKIHPKRYKNFTEAKDEIKANLVYKIAEVEINNMLEALEDDIASGATLSEIAKKHKLQLKEFTKTKLNEAQNKNKVEQFVFDIAFNSDEMQESEIVAMEDDQGYVIVNVTEILPQKVLSFGEAKDEVRARYIEKFKDDIALDAAQKFAKDPDEDVFGYIRDKFKVNSLRVKVTNSKEEVSRPEIGQNKLPDNLVAQIFDLGINKLSSAEKVSNGIYLVAQVDKIITDEKLSSEIHRQVTELSEMNYKNEIYDQYINYLKNKYNVEVYFEVIAVE